MEEIDFPSVVEALQRENERLRMRILKLCNARSPFEGVNFVSVREWLVDNYVFIAAIGAFLFILLSLFDMLKGLISHSKGE